MGLLGVISGDIEGCFAYGITFILVGRILSTTSSKCYNAYSAGYSYDRAASFFELISIMAFALGAFLLIISLLHSGIQSNIDILSMVSNNGPHVEEGIAEHIISEFDSNMQNLTNSLIQDCE